MGDAADQLVCPHLGCGRVLSRADRLRNHIKLHDGQKPFSCDEPGCMLAYVTARALARHKKAKHDETRINELNLFCCPRKDCSVTFAHEQSVIRHVRSVHEKPPKFLSCDLCSARFKKQSKLKEHMYTHNGVKPFTCDIPDCGRGFSRLSKLKLHNKVHAGYICKECGPSVIQKFVSWSELVHHRKLEHRKEREKRFLCSEPECSHAYTRLKYLRQHIARIHRGEREVCPHCRRTLATAQKLRFHIETYHTGENPKPLPPFPKQGNGRKRRKKLSPEEKKQEKLEKLAEQLSGVQRLKKTDKITTNEENSTNGVLCHCNETAEDEPLSVRESS